MINIESCYCIILAGGRGRRLWPCSREKMPKQFVDFFGMGQTQLQQTYNRLAKLFPKENILISTNNEYKDIVKQQLADLPDENLLAEPVHRNTAPSIAWALFRIRRKNPNAQVIVTPSDQTVQDEDLFLESIRHGFDFLSRTDGVLVLGVKPTRPEPGYGYLQIGEKQEEDVFHVKSFIQKPEREFAKIFMENGEFYWNTGMILATVPFLYEKLKRLLPPVLRALEYLQQDALTLEKENEYVAQNFSRYPNISLDNGILEQGQDVYVMESRFGWADLGTWHSIYEALQRGNGDNVVIDSDVLLDETKNCVIKLPKNHYAVINGLDGYIIAEKDNMLLICRKEDSSALVRKFVNEVQMRKGDDFI